MSDETPRVRWALWSTLACILAAVAHLNTLGHPFVFDDQKGILQNPSIRDLSNLRWIVIGSRRVLVNFSYAVDWAIGADRPFVWHLTNVGFHVLNVWLLFRLARRLVRLPAGAFAAAALLAVHPLMTESVGYVSSRAGLMATTFLLVAALACHRAIVEHRAGWWIAAVGAMALGGLCKESAGMLPFLFLAIDRWFASDPQPARRRRLVLVHGPLIALVLVAAALRIYSYLRLEAGLSRPFGPHLLVQADVWWRYARLLMIPLGQSLVHSVPSEVSGAWLPGWISLVALVLVCVLIFRQRRAEPVVALGALWFCLFLLPSSLVPLRQEMAEHRLYEPSVGFFLAVGALTAHLLPRLSRRGRRLSLAAGAAILCLLGAVTITRNQVWASSVHLWSDAAAKAPSEWAAQYSLGDAYREAGQCERAVEAYRAAVALRPDYVRARINLGICLATLGQLDEARAQLRESLRARPTDPSLHYDLALVEVERGDLAIARQHLRSAVGADDPTLACELWKKIGAGEPPPPTCER